MKTQRYQNFKSLIRDTYDSARMFKDGGISVNAKSLSGKRGFELPPTYRIKESYKYFEGSLPRPYKEDGVSTTTKVIFPKIRELTAALTEILDTTANTVEYTGYNDQDTQFANVATEFIQKQLEKNRWNNILQSLVNECLIAGVSFVKRYYEDVTEDRVNRYSGITKEEFDAIKKASPTSDFTIDETITKEFEVPLMEVDEQGNQVQTGVKKTKVKLFDVTETYEKTLQGIKIEWVPQEEIYMLAHDNKIEEASYLCQRKLMYRYEIRNMFKGRKFTKIIDTAIPDSYLEQIDEDNDYNALQKIEGNISSSDKERDKLFLFEQYVRFGSKLYQVFSVGLVDNILEYNEVDEIPFEAFVPIRISDSLWSMSVVDSLKDEQDAQTAITRGFLDNIMGANYGRYMAVKGQVDKKALLDNRHGGVVEQNAPGMIERFPYHAIPNGADFMYQQIGLKADDIAGSSQASTGAAEKLLAGSATGAAIAASIKELREKDIARSVVLSGLVPLYKALYRISRDNINTVSIINVKGQEIEVQPAMWPEDIDIKVDIVTKQDRAVKAQNESYFFTQLAQLRQTSITPEEWYSFAASLSKALGIEYIMSDVIKPEEIPQPQPSPEQQLALAKVEADTEETRARIETARLEAQVKLQQLELEKQKEATTAYLEGRKLALEEYKAGMTNADNELDRNLRENEAIADNYLTAKGLAETGKITNVKVGNE